MLSIDHIRDSVTEQNTRKKAKILIKFKPSQGVQRTLRLINIFAIDASRYTKTTQERRVSSLAAKSI
jgi:hypothetical protein